MTGRRRTAAAAAIAGALLVAACAADEPEDPGDSVVTVFGPFVGVDADLFSGVLSDFEAETGIEVVYTGSIDFVVDIAQRTTGNQRPDVAIVPQPALARLLQEFGALAPLPAATVDAVDEAFDPDQLATSPWDLAFAVPYRSNTKSLVWYRPSVFEENGWSRPETMEELDELAAEIADGGEMAPWCFSIFSGTATGWPATDWVEDLVLRRGGPDAYDDWASGGLSWQSTLVRNAFEEFEALVLADARSAGGLRAVLRTEVALTSEPLFDERPGCAMYKQASFAEDWFPDGTEIGRDGDVDFFVLPGAERGTTSLVAGGEAAVAFNDRADVGELMTFLASSDGGRSWAGEGGFVSQRVDVDVDEYYNDTDSLFAELLRSDADIRFDASDRLSPEVGSSALWTMMTQWIAGEITLDKLLSDIDEALQIGPTGS